MTDISVVTFTAKLQNKNLTKNRVDADEASDRHPDATVGKFHARSPVIPSPPAHPAISVRNVSFGYPMF